MDQTQVHSHRAGALSPEMVLRGQLYGGPAHGYDLHRKVVSDLGHVWHLSQSQAYSIIKRLISQGDVLAEEIPQDKLPSRQLLHLSPAGSNRFLHWLDTPSGGSLRAIRMEFITRIYFTARYFPKKLPSLFEIQREEVKYHINRLGTIHKDLPDNQIYNKMSLDLRLKQLYLVLDWLEESKKLFQQENS